MASTALRTWREVRLARVGDLLAVRRALGGDGRARHLDAALVVALAAEFQAFARALYDEAARFFSATLAGGNTAVADLLLRELTENTQLGRGNAHPGSLGADFRRLGLDLWAELYRTDTRADARNRDLTALNDARNAVAHAKPVALEEVRARGYPLTPATIRRWRSTTDCLAGTMDRVASAHLAELFAVAAPW